MVRLDVGIDPRVTLPQISKTVFSMVHVPSFQSKTIGRFEMVIHDLKKSCSRPHGTCDQFVSCNWTVSRGHANELVSES